MGRNVLIVGAGITGAVIARQLAEAGIFCHVIDSRAHLAGNCYTERDPATGIMVHKYGPHIFHTADMEVWNWMKRFGTFENYSHRVYAESKGKVYNLPINLQTLNQFFGKKMSPQEAIRFVSSELAEKIDTTGELDFERQALSLFGRRLYEAFFKGYTEKQWGCSASDIPGSVLMRLPFRFNYDSSYFDHPIQAMPRNGYTEVFENIFEHKNIRVDLETQFEHSYLKQYDHVFYSGQLDRYFDFSGGRLAYRTLRFEEIRVKGDFQGCPVMNYCDAEIPWTRITEHKHFAPWEQYSHSVCYREHSRSCEEGDIPYYPVKLSVDNKVLDYYQTLAVSERNVSFVGRLGAFKYMDMDKAVSEALKISRAYLS